MFQDFIPLYHTEPTTQALPRLERLKSPSFHSLNLLAKSGRAAFLNSLCADNTSIELMDWIDGLCSVVSTER